MQAVTPPIDHLDRGSRIVALCLTALAGAFFVAGALTPYRSLDLSFNQGLSRFITEFVMANSVKLSPIDILTNFFAFIPLGLGLSYAIYTSRVGVGNTILRVLLTLALFSLGVEFSQSWFFTRVPSILDWILNSSGSAMGVALYFSARLAISSATSIRGLAFLGLVGYCGFLVLTLLSPFHLVGSNEIAWAKLNSFFLGAIGGSYKIPLEEIFLQGLLKMFLIVPLGFLAGAVTDFDDSEGSWYRSLFKFTIWLGILTLLVCLEIAQAWIVSRIPEALDVQIYLAGSVLGWGSYRVAKAQPWAVTA